jgi:ATP-binding cassette subfamily B multidrug efflux pump
MTGTTQHDDQILGKAYDARLMKRLLRYLKPYRMIMALSLLLLTLYTGMQL